MKNGNFMKEKTEYIKEKFKTHEGLWDFFVGSFIWGFIIVKYKDMIFNYILNLISFLGQGIIKDYIAYLCFGIFLTLLGWAISYVLNKIFKVVKTNER